MAFLSGLLAIGSGVAALVGGVAKARARKRASSLAARQETKDAERKKLIAARQEEQRKENEKARKKSALQRAFGIQGGVSAKQVAGVGPREILKDPKIEKALNLGNIFGGISGGLSAASTSKFFNRPFRQKGVTPGVSVLFRPGQKDLPIA